jgi:glycosyltransferase involved in cell wall biosynthesis
MHIAYAYDRLLPGTGADCEQALNTIAALTRQGADVTLVVPVAPGTDVPTAEQLQSYYQVSGTFRVMGVPCHGLDWIVSRKVLAARAIAKALKAHSFDIVYTRNLLILIAMLSRGHRTAYDSHRAWPTHLPVLRPLLRWAMHHPAFVAGIFHSDYARQSYVRMGIDASKLTVAYNGFEPSRLNPVLSQSEARRLLELPDDKPIVVYTGHVNLTKGLGIVLEIAKRCPEVLFILVGSESEEGAIERRARALKNVMLVPWQRFDNTAKYLYAADVLCIPPSAAPLKLFGHTVLPLKLYIYLAVRRPIIAPYSADLLELLHHEETALLSRPGDVNDAVHSLKRLLNDHCLQQTLSLNTSKLSADLTWDRRAIRLIHFLSHRLNS